MVKKLAWTSILCTATLFAGGVKTVSLHIPDEIAPPGGMVQMKFMVTEPTPIATGSVHFSFDGGMFSGVFGISLFNLAGDVSGAAVIQGSQVHLRYTTTAGTTGTDYPIMSVALGVRPDALPGQKTQFAIDPTSQWILDLFGPAFLKPTPPANITVTGSVSITDVTPGGGTMAAGSVVKIHGMGFLPHTSVQVDGAKLSSIVFVNSQEIDVTIAAAVQFTGRKIQVVNPDGSQDVYFSYMRGKAVGASSDPLLAATVPVFSQQTHSQARFMVRPAGQGQFTGLAIQNPNQTTASIVLHAYGLFGNLLGTATFDLQPATRIARTLMEWMPDAGRAAVVTINATAPMQVFEVFGDSATNTVLPFRPIFATP